MQKLREPLKIHFGGQANLFGFGWRQAKASLASTKADLPSLPKTKNLHLAAQKQLLELPLKSSFFRPFRAWGFESSIHRMLTHSANLLLSLRDFVFNFKLF